MRRLSANYIYPVSSPPLKNGIIEIDDKGQIQHIIDTKGSLKETRNLEFYNGVIVPGFVNTHCHLELSGLKSKIPQQTGLPDFLKNMFVYKNQHKTTDHKAIKYYDGLMHQNGIVAVGDISNNKDTLDVKKSSKIYYHTFVEAIGLNEKKTKEIFALNKTIYDKFKENNLNASITPHAPYSVSRKLFKLIKDFAIKNNSILSIHNQETLSENQLFLDKTGKMANLLNDLKINLNNLTTTGKSSLESILGYLPTDRNIIFVHNIFSTEEDIKKTHCYFPSNIYWCLCPLSNLFIENKMPKIDLFLNHTNNITIGTDSLASNKTLSILEEMKAIADNFNNISFDKLITWATLNGAKALKIDNKIGSIEIGKTPGINLITNFDFNRMQITKQSEVKALLN